MTSLAALWLPILLSAVFVFIISSVMHMAVQFHCKDFKKLPDEDAVRAALRKANAPPGQYMIPCGESMKAMSDPEFLAKFEEGPVGTLIMRPTGPWSMGPALLKWFVFSLIVSVFCGYLAAIGNGPGTAAKTIFQVTGAVAFLGYAFSHVHEWTWKGLPGGTMLRFAFDGVLYTLATAGTFAWLWPAAA